MVVAYCYACLGWRFENANISDIMFAKSVDAMAWHLSSYQRVLKSFCWELSIKRVGNWRRSERKFSTNRANKIE